MTTHLYEVKWPDGTTTTDSSESKTVDAYAMERWGRSSAEEVERELGVSISNAAAPDEQTITAEDVGDLGSVVDEARDGEAID